MCYNCPHCADNQKPTGGVVRVCGARRYSMQFSVHGADIRAQGLIQHCSKTISFLSVGFTGA